MSNNHTNVIYIVLSNTCFNQSPIFLKEFFSFLRTMQACRDTFGDTDMSMVIVPGQVCEKFFGEID